MTQRGLNIYNARDPDITCHLWDMWMFFEFVNAQQVLGNVQVPGAYTEIVIRGCPGIDVEVNLASAKGASHYRHRGVWGHASRKMFEISITNGAL